MHVFYLNPRIVPVPIMNYIVLGLEEQQQWMIVVQHLAKMKVRLDNNTIPELLAPTAEEDEELPPQK